MLLSNSAKSFLICGFILLTVPACKWWQGTDAGSTSDPVNPNGLPFSTAEPDTFQCQVVRSDGEHEQKTFFARKGEAWRFDLSDKEIFLRIDKYYRINSEKKIYAELPEGDASTTPPDFLSDMTFSVLKEKRGAKFETLGREGGLVKYSVKLDDSANAKAVIYADETSGLIVREEFFSLDGQSDETAKPVFIFELRDLKMNVDDNVFAIPAGYKKLEWKDYLKASQPKK